MSQIKNEISVKRIIEPNVIPKIKRRRNKEILISITNEEKFLRGTRR